MMQWYSLRPWSRNNKWYFYSAVPRALARHITIIPSLRTGARGISLILCLADQAQLSDTINDICYVCVIHTPRRYGNTLRRRGVGCVTRVLRWGPQRLCVVAFEVELQGITGPLKWHTTDIICGHRCLCPKNGTRRS